MIRKQIFFLMFHSEFSSGHCSSEPFQLSVPFSWQSPLTSNSICILTENLGTPEDYRFLRQEDKMNQKAFEISCLDQGAIYNSSSGKKM